MGIEGDSLRSPVLGPPTPGTYVKSAPYSHSVSLNLPKRSTSQPQTAAERRMGFTLGQNGRVFTEVILNPTPDPIPDPGKAVQKSSARFRVIETATVNPPTSPERLSSRLLSNQEERQYFKPEPYPSRTRLSRLHFGPFFLGAPVVPPTPGKYQCSPSVEGSNQECVIQPVPQADLLASPYQLRLQGRGGEGTATNRFPADQRRSQSFLQRLGSRRSRHRNLDRHLTSREHVWGRRADRETDEDELALTDISTLDGGSIDFGRLSTTTTTSEKFMLQDVADSASDDEDTPGLNTKVVAGREAVVSPLTTFEACSVNRSQKDDDFRAKAIRIIGQQWAEKEQAIVAVTETPPTVDLSSLGAAKRHQSLGNVECLLPISSSTFGQDQQSYFYPTDPEQPNWKPFAIRTPFMTLLIVLSILLAAIQEWLCQKSQSLANSNDGLIKFNDAVEVSVASFFCWKYLPTLIFVTYGVLWQITDYEIKRLEPYYQLSRPTGSRASTSLNLDYLSANPFWVPVKSFRFRHWAVFCSSTCSLFATLIAPALQNPSIIFIENPLCHEGACSSGNQRYFVRVHPVWSRLLTTSLFAVAIFGIFLSIRLRRKSGLLSDPKGIAGIASMATKSHILTDFQEMDEALHSEIHERLKHRYILYKSTIWHGEYIKQNKPDTYAERKVENPHPFILQPETGIAFLALLFLCLILIPIINFTPLNVVAVSLPWLPVLVASLVKLFWTMLELAIRAIEPFYILSKGNAPPQMTLTLDYRGTPYGLLPFKAFRNRHYIVALAGVGSILGDILTVTVSSFSVNGNDLIRRSHDNNSNSKDNANKNRDPRHISVEDQTFLSFWISVALSCAILLFLIVSAIFIYVRRRHPFLPRQPSTIASVLAFTYQSRMLDDFVDTERLNNWQMEERLKMGGKRYGLGWFKGRDGKPHCAVDEEPMLSRYVHGASYIKATAPWEDI
ncbi:hypothetical protein GX50_02481 [[Emmonsia] crescens]|uniref:Uncharacterized protein n=1 Tax=[Emmonsia] crescens TaxID=73230 RepID=A0A2B7ZNE6_9EURO|nr:hypothetical protein GX50_02481 [Emmonsia crescens]